MCAVPHNLIFFFNQTLIVFDINFNMVRLEEFYDLINELAAFYAFVEIIPHFVVIQELAIELAVILFSRAGRFRRMDDRFTYAVRTMVSTAAAAASWWPA